MEVAAVVSDPVLMYGIMLDAAYKLKKIAEREKENHKKKGWWQDKESASKSEC